jgi:hypothetical protein
VTNPNAGAASSTTITTLSDQELRAVAYFAMGVGSESAIGGRNVAYDLRFAGNINSETRIMVPVGNSGYSLGTIQTDLGQHPDKAPGLVDAYQSWAQSSPIERAGWDLTEQQRTQVIVDLQRTGRVIKGSDKESESDNGVDIDATIKSRLNTFLASDAGITYIHSRDVEQIDHLMRKTNPPENQSALEGLQGTTLYQNASADDQIKLATMFIKLENQSGKFYYPGIINNIKDGEATTVDEVKAAIKAVGPGYVDSGIDHALKGADALIALKNSSDQNPLHRAWQNVLADPLINPTQLANGATAGRVLPFSNEITGAPGPGYQNAAPFDAIPVGSSQLMTTNSVTASEYTIVKNIFLQPAEGIKFVEALDRGGTYSFGFPQQEGNSRPTAGFYVAGNDFVQWNRDGVGQANIGGVWSDISRSDLTRVKNPNRTIDLSIMQDGVARQLLHVDPSSPALRPLTAGAQTQAAPHGEAPAQQNLRHAPPAQDMRDRQGPNPQRPNQFDPQERPGQAPPVPRRGAGGQVALGSDDLNPQDKEQYEKIRIALQKLGFDGEPAANISAALLLATIEHGGIRRIDDITLNERGKINVEGTLAIATYRPHGVDKPPYFNVRVELAEASLMPAEKTFKNIEDFNQQQSQQQALAQQKAQEKQQSTDYQGQSPQLPGGPARPNGPSMA